MFTHNIISNEKNFITCRVSSRPGQLSVRIFASLGDHSVGPFLVGSKLFNILLLIAPNDMFEVYVTDSEFMDFHLLMIHNLDLLLLGCGLDCGMSLPFFGLTLCQLELSEILIPIDPYRA